MTAIGSTEFKTSAPAPGQNVMELVYNGYGILPIIENILPKTFSEDDCYEKMSVLISYLTEDNEGQIDAVIPALAHFAYFNFESFEVRSKTFEKVSNLAFTYKRFHMAREIAEKIPDPITREQQMKKIHTSADFWHLSIKRSLVQLLEVCHVEPELIPGLESTIKEMKTEWDATEEPLPKEMCDTVYVRIHNILEKAKSIVEEFRAKTLSMPKTSEAFNKRYTEDQKFLENRLPKIEQLLSLRTPEKSSMNKFFKTLHEIEKWAQKNLCVAVLSTVRGLRCIQSKYSLIIQNGETIDQVVDEFERESLSVSRIYGQCLKLSRQTYSEEQKAELSEQLKMLNKSTKESMWEKMEAMLTTCDAIGLGAVVGDFVARCDKAFNIMETMLFVLDNARREMIYMGQ